MTVNTLGGDLASGRTRAAAWLPPLVPIAIATFALSALVSYHLRTDGGSESRSLLQWAIIGIYEFFGFVPSFLFFLLVLSWSSIWFVTGKLERPVALLVRLLGLTLALAIWVNLRADTGESLPHSGALGAWIGGRMVSALGTVLSTLLVAPLTLVSLLLATDYFFISYFEGLGARNADKDGRSGESGVEADVTEQFKSLARVFAPARSASSVAPAPAPAQAPLGDLVAIDDLETAVAELERASEGLTTVGQRAAVRAPSAADEVAEDEVDVPPRRLSYFERRQLAAAREAAAAEPAPAESGEPAGDAAVQALVETPAPAETLADRSEVEDEFAIAASALDGPAPAGRLAPLAEDVEQDPVAGEAPIDEIVPAAANETEGEDEDDDATVEIVGFAESDTEDDEAGADEADDDAAAEPGALSSAAPERAASASAVGDADDGDGDDSEGVASGEDLEAESAVEIARNASAVPVAADDAPAAGDEGADEGDRADEPLVAIPRPAEGVRQQRLFLSGLDEALVREAIDIVQSTRRASATLLQRRLRIDYEQAREVLAVLAHRGVVELADDGSQGRVRS